MDNLFVVIPAYNEEANIDLVAEEWHRIVEKVGAESKLVIIDDGSKDATFQKLTELSTRLPKLIAISKENTGHGGTVLYGYKYALENGADYVFQTDSDGQTIADEFWPFWENRTKYDIQLGYRKNRKDGLGRIIVTRVLKLILFLSFGSWITDANTPFRLMEKQKLSQYYKLIPENYNLANVLLTVFYEKSNSKVRYLKITFRQRQGGVNSINMKRIFRIGRQAIKDFGSLRSQVKTVKQAKRLEK